MRPLQFLQLLFVLTTLLFPSALSAEHRVTHVRLKNGNTLEGTIVKTTDEQITLAIEGLGNLTISRAEIASMGEGEATSPPAAASPLEWEVYEDPAHDIRIQYPKGWHVKAEDTPDMHGVFLSKEPILTADTKFKTGITLMQIHDAANKFGGLDFQHPDKAAQQWLAMSLQAFGEPAKLEASKTVQLNGQPALYVVLSAHPEGGHAMRLIKVIQFSTQTLTEITMEAPERAFEQVNVAYQAILQDPALRVGLSTVGTDPAPAGEPKTAQDFIKRGQWYLRQADLEKALADLRQATTLEPNSAEAHFALARGYSSARRLAEATAAAEQAVRLAPANADYLYYLGGQYCAAAELAQAKEAFQRALTAAQQASQGVEVVDLALRRVRVLETLVDPKQVGQLPLGEKPFTGTWRRPFTRIARLEFPAYKESALQALKQQFEQLMAKQQDDPDEMEIAQYGGMLQAADGQGQYVGYAVDRWFVLSRGEAGTDEAWRGCSLTQRTIIAGELTPEGTLIGTWTMDSAADQPEQCPDALGTAVLEFVASKKVTHERVAAAAPSTAVVNCALEFPAPELAAIGKEDYSANGKRWTRYKLRVLNRAVYPQELFARTPDLPPCGKNNYASRTQISLYTDQDKYLYGFCAGGPRTLDGLWFAVPQGEPPPQGVYVQLADQRCHTTYKSNSIAPDVITAAPVPSAAGTPEEEADLQAALERAEAQPGEGDFGLLSPLMELAMFYERQRAYAKAEPYRKQILAIEEKAGDPERILTALYYLAAAYEGRRDYASAEPFNRKALDIAERVLKSPKTIDNARNHLAFMYENAGRYEEMLALRLVMLKANEEQLGPTDHWVGFNALKTALALTKLNRLTEAIPYFEQALTIRQQLGDAHDTAEVLLQYAMARENSGQFIEAQKLLEQGRDMLSKSSEASDAGPLLRVIEGRLRVVEARTVSRKP